MSSYKIEYIKTNYQDNLVDETNISEATMTLMKLMINTQTIKQKEKNSDENKLHMKFNLRSSQK